MNRILTALTFSCALLGATAASDAVAIAQIGGVVGASAGAGTCSESHSVPSSPQDTLSVAAVAVCSGASVEARVRADAGIPSLGLQANVADASGGSSANAFVALSDVWTIGLPPATPLRATFTLPIKFELEGAVSADAEYGRSPGRFLEFSGSLGQVGAASGVFQASAVVDGVGNFDQTFAGRATFTNYGPSLPTLAIFEASLYMHPLYRGSVDFFHTLSATVDVPAGFSITSSSGTPLFTVAAVPEPETFLLLLGGLAVLGRLRMTATGPRKTAPAAGTANSNCASTSACASV